MSIMKKIHSIPYFRGSLFGLAAALLLASCSEDEITYNAGQQPDKGALETVVGTLRSSKSLRDRVPMHVVENDAEKDADKIYFRLNSAASQDVTVTAAPDLSLVDEYNAANKTSLKPLPAANVTIANNGRITVPAGARVSERVEIAFSADGLEPGIYLLPVVLDDGAKAADQRQVLYYGLTVRKFDKNIIQSGDDTFDAELDTEWTTVFYVNTSEVQAHYADYVAWEKQDMDSFEMYIVRLSVISSTCGSHKSGMMRYPNVQSLRRRPTCAIRLSMPTNIFARCRTKAAKSACASRAAAAVWDSAI